MKPLNFTVNVAWPRWCMAFTYAFRAAASLSCPHLIGTGKGSSGLLYKTDFNKAGVLVFCPKICPHFCLTSYQRLHCACKRVASSIFCLTSLLTCSHCFIVLHLSSFLLHQKDRLLEWAVDVRLLELIRKDLFQVVYYICMIM